MILDTLNRTTNGVPADAESAFITSLREFLADTYSARITRLTPQVCRALAEKRRQNVNAEDKRAMRTAIRCLSERAAPLREEISRSFRQRFDAKLDPPDDALSFTGRFSPEQLALMNELGMQEEFELEECVNQIRKQCCAELFELSVRLRKLLGRNALPESHNPAFPRVLLRTLLEALSAIGCEGRSKQVAFRALTPWLPALASDLYAQANAFLALAKRESTRSPVFCVAGASATRGHHYRTGLPMEAI